MVIWFTFPKERYLMKKPQNSKSRCTRCGKARVVVKTYEKEINGSKILYKLTGCPDPECQKKVEEGLQKEKEKREKIKADQEKREEQRRKNSKKKTATNKKK